MKRLILLALAASAFSCTKAQVAAPLCAVLAQTIVGTAQGVADALKCSNVPAIAATLSDQIGKLNMCTATSQQGVIGDAVCPQVAGFVVGIGVGALPPAWGCTGGIAADQASAVLLKACKDHVTF